jgi:hypothetical protein
MVVEAREIHIFSLGGGVKRIEPRFDAGMKPSVDFGS